MPKYELPGIYIEHDISLIIWSDKQWESQKFTWIMGE